jgi:UDP-N-acetylmuramoyl-tripeptide--D-alanyl-D-alanine ligase
MKVSFGYMHPTLQQICEMCGGKLHGKACGVVDTVCTDSREAEKNSLFLAIRGEKVDGHKYINSAAKLGASCAIAERVPEEGSDIPLVIVDDTLAALARLSEAYARLCHSGVKKVAVTGSVGKTTAKEMIASVLGVSHKVFKSDGNYNSLIGMPLSQISIPEGTEFAVLEMGMSHAGEISLMSRISHPNVALITNIGTSHLENFDSRAGIASAKLEVVEGLDEDGLLLLCAGEPLLSEVGSWDKRAKYYCAEGEAELHSDGVRMLDGKTVFNVGNIKELEIPALGKHNVHAAVGAVGIAEYFGVCESDIRAGLRAYKSVGMRQQILEIGGITIINDCYNASPESMRAAAEVLFTLAEKRGGKKLALLGDMLELGGESEQLHFAVGGFFAEHGLDVLFAFGERAQAIADGASKAMRDDAIVRFTDTGAEAISTVAKNIASRLSRGDCLLIKASRAMAAERVTAALGELIGEK